ncbi:phosphoribosyl-ATP diphosphatase [Blastomonas sp.]|uniref:phosphoribosyl-ATP diphosphatase n=1 Tax=Blastomonas sp. TaxID=1909299 RepID=UPI0026142098|nr:phosphoribosyl-ATP diphosphatase [Blastomonas sp.]MDM7957217.1 phosphoribosyl-ATP diphosphatase [Blastomonas sp.]
MADPIIQRLEAVIAERRSALPDSSYVARLSSKGRARIAQKIGEEGVETVIAAMKNDGPGVISESADLVFHLLVLFADMGLSWDQLLAELDAREGVSGIAEKASRPKE